MPDNFGLVSPAMKRARKALEYCRFAYKMYAQTCKFPMDPFYESWGSGLKGDISLLASARKRLMERIHERLGTAPDNRKFDPIEYELTRTPNPHEGAVYRGGTDDKYILFQPRPLDLRISHAQGFDLEGEPVDGGLALNGDGARCGYFQGRTGATQNHPTAGWASYLGAAIFHPNSKTLYITFRGSRSGDGARAMGGAQVYSSGSPDWVTDMNHLKGVKVPRYGNSTLACGFFYAYESCARSLEMACWYATNGAKPRKIIITGHSLGGALAQNAFLDLTCGRLLLDMGVRWGDIQMECYPISAPPICHGRESQHWFSRNADASSIHHFYNPKDVVHACDLVTPSTFTRLNGTVAFSTHALTTAYHLGSQVALECEEGFPNAHEPEHVWRGMHNGQTDPGFWPEFRLNVAAETTVVRDLPNPVSGALASALQASCSMVACRERADEWRNVIKGDGNKLLFRKDKRRPIAEKGVEKFGMARGLLTYAEDVEEDDIQEAVKELRRQVLADYTQLKSHSASSSVHYTLLLGLAVQQYVSVNGGGRLRRALSITDIDLDFSGLE